jgi:putative DNA methylase
MLAAVIAKAETVRQLAYRLYTICERSGRSEDARAYNDLITSWSPIETVAQSRQNEDIPKQSNIFDTI